MRSATSMSRLKRAGHLIRSLVEQKGQVAVVCGHFIGCLLVDSTILPFSNYRWKGSNSRTATSNDVVSQGISVGVFTSDTMLFLPISSSLVSVKLILFKETLIVLRSAPWWNVNLR